MEALLKEMKKKSVNNVLWISIILMLVGIGILAVNGSAIRQIFTAIVGCRDLNDIPKTELNNTVAQCEIDIVYDCFAEYKTGNGKVYDYYIIPYGNKNFNLYYIAVHVNANKAKQLDSICDDFWEYYAGNKDTLDKSVSVKGNVRLMNSDERYYYKSWFEEMGYSDEEISEYAVTYVLMDGEYAGNVSSVRLYVMTAAALFLLIVSICIIVKACTGGYLKALKQDFAQLGAYAESRIATDYQNAYVVNKNVRIGRLFTYNATPTAPRAYLNNNMAWAYQHRTKNYTNGIYTGSSYNVIIYPARGTDKMGDIAIKKKLSEQILEFYANNFPHMIVGYSDELRDMYNNDRNRFLSLRYLPAQQPQNDDFDNMNTFIE